MATYYHKPTWTKSFLRRITRVKHPNEMLEDASKEGLEKTLGVWDLIILGIGAIIGSGIFAIAGQAASDAGPALVLSMLISAFACVFSALCYSEFAAMIPVAGGAYVYTFATLGEFAACMVGWILVLEYVIGYIAVACAWSNHVMQFLKGFSNVLPAWIANPPIWLVNDARSAGVIAAETGAHIPHLLGMPICINIPAILIVVATTAILIKGTKDSTKMATIMVIIKLLVIALFVVAGAFFVRPENWTPFAPHGANGIFMGAFMIFFAFIGFDALATTAEECKNPQTDLPAGILGSLLITTIVYVAVALVMTGNVDTSGAVPVEFLKAPMAYIMGLYQQTNWAAGLISIGSIAGLTSVLLVFNMAGTRILYAMSRDHFLSKKFMKLHPKFHTPHLLSWAVGILSILGILFLDLSDAAGLCNLGTLASFIVVCAAVLILRKTEPERHRPFKVPFSPWFPLMGILCCAGLMFYSVKTSPKSVLLFPIFLMLGGLVYIQYGYTKNRHMENKAHTEKIKKLSKKKQELKK